MKIYGTQNTNMSSAQKSSLKTMIDIASEMGESGEITAQKVEDIKVAFSRLKAEVAETGNTGKSFFSQIGNRLTDMNSKFIAQFFSWQDWIRYIQQGIQVVTELDTAFTEMRKVSDETTQSLKNYQETTFDVADAVGTTAAQIQNSTADWMRLGESMDEAAESAKASNILYNVSEFESIDEATESLVSMSQAYKDLDKMEIIDVLNNIGNRYSISTDGLATALQDSASSLETANNDLNEAVALTTAGNAVTQDPSSVGAGLRTISLRLVGRHLCPNMQ